MKNHHVDVYTIVGRSDDTWKQKIKPGDFVLRRERGISIAVEILDPITTAEEDEREFLREWYESLSGRDYRYGRHFSSVCLCGELGDMHISTAVRMLSREEFAAMIQHWRNEQ